MTTSVKYDDKKDRWDLLPLRAIKQVVKVLTFGAEKYAPDGWRTVPNPIERYYAAHLRHLTAWREGEEMDSESGLPHLAHALCNLLFIYELEAEGTEK